MVRTLRRDVEQLDRRTDGRRHLLFGRPAEIHDADQMRARLELCQFDPGTHLIGVVYLGWPADQHVETPARPPVELFHVPA